MSRSLWFVALALAVPLVGGEPVKADKKASPETIAFGALAAPSADAARAQTLDWIKSTGKMDEATLRAFDGIWGSADEQGRGADPQRQLLDRVADTLVLVDGDAARLLGEARDASRPAPTAAPEAIKDASRPGFYRANLALAYAKALCQRRVYEEALEVLRSVRPEQVVDPAAYLFHRAVAEHALMRKDESCRSIMRLLDDAQGSPDRYRMVATLMFLDMQSWKDKDLGTIARMMDNVERRLDLARGGPQTQKQQKQIVARLDELIKDLENKCKGSSQCNGGGCPNGGPPNNNGGNQGPQPQLDSNGGKNSGPGEVDRKKLSATLEQWGKLPEKERARVMQDLTRDMPPEYREWIEAYFRRLAQSEANRP